MRFEMSTTITKVRDLTGFTGHAALYELSEPVGYDMDWDTETTSKETCFVVISAADVMFSGPETYIFAANSDGEIVNWSELDGSYRGELTMKAQSRAQAGTWPPTPSPWRLNMDADRCAHQQALRPGGSGGKQRLLVSLGRSLRARMSRKPVSIACAVSNTLTLRAGLGCQRASGGKAARYAPKPESCFPMKFAAPKWMGAAVTRGAFGHG